MLKSNLQTNNQTNHQKGLGNSQGNFKNHKKLVSMGKSSVNIINELYNPIDAINRFINLALQSLEEDAQSRQFLIESKKGIRKTSVLLKRLNNYVKRIEAEINKTLTGDE